MSSCSKPAALNADECPRCVELTPAVSNGYPSTIAAPFSRAYATAPRRSAAVTLRPRYGRVTKKQRTTQVGSQEESLGALFSSARAGRTFRAARSSTSQPVRCRRTPARRSGWHSRRGLSCPAASWRRSSSVSPESDGACTSNSVGCPALEETGEVGPALAGDRPNLHVRRVAQSSHSTAPTAAAAQIDA